MHILCSFFFVPQRQNTCNILFFSENVSSIYTSGRKCNFKGKGCDAEHLQPINVNGWFWAGAGNARIPATNEASPDSHWSRTGE